MIGRLWRRLGGAAPLVVLAAVIFVPLLLTEPGMVGADTKSYLYLDPTRLLSRAWSMWDPSIGLGTITHQNLCYLWPMGPFYWAFETLGVPDWVAQRLWLGTILFAAGAGVRYLCHTLDQRGPQVTAAMFLFALSPYVLTLAARISVILLPFAGLPWLIAFTVRALRQGGWRYPALFALTVTTVGSVNATALLLAGLGPFLWVIHATFVVKEVSFRTAASAVGRIGVLTVPVSLWWLAGLAVQGGYGIEILRYTETAEVVAAASLAPEVLRGLGYWYFYGDDRLGPWIEPSVPYTQRLALLAVTFAIPALGLLAAGLTRWRHRFFVVALVVTGTLLAIGAYPWDDPPPLGAGIKAFLLSDTGLAMRSLPRAVPLLALGMALLIANGLAAVGERRPRLKVPVSAWLALLAVLAVPPLWTGALVADNLKRPEDIPDYWSEAARALDERDDGSRVLEIPGAAFASYRWGNTVDPVTPGIIDRPYVARELIPYGSAASADLLRALDRRFQEDVFDPAALAPVARLMAAGDVLVRSDLQYERYRTPRPRVLWDTVLAAPGLTEPVSCGPAEPNRPDPSAPLQDELALNTDPELPDPPPVAILGVEGAEPVVRTKAAGVPIVVAGDGEGIVELAAAGLIDGEELLLYSGSFADRPDDLRALLDSTGEDASCAPGAACQAALVVTDTNQRAAERWTTLRHNSGLTAEAGREQLAVDLTDNRLPLFPDADDDSFTVAEHRGGVHARATSIGNPITYTPELRPANAVDGDLRTTWITGGFSEAESERLVLTFDEPVTTDRITLLQPVFGPINRHLTDVRLHLDEDDPVDVNLTDASRSAPGQTVTFGERTFSRLEIELTGDTAGRRSRFSGLTGVGFAEVTVGDGGEDADALQLDEVIRVPTDLLDVAGDASADHSLAFVLRRARSDPSEATRSDEELNLVRSFTVPTERSFTAVGEVRLSALAPDDVLDELLGLPSADEGGVTATSSDRLPGGRDKRASAAIDGDDTTAWTTPFASSVGRWVEYEAAEPITADRMELTVVADGRHSVPTSLGVVADGEPLGSVEVPAVVDGEERGHTETVTVDLPPLDAETVRFVIEDVRAVDTIDWYSRQPIAQPVAIAELRLGGLALDPPTGAVDDRCRNDLLALDGDPVDVRLDGTVAEAVAGEALALSLCDDELALDDGEHVLRSAEGRDGGLDVDRVVLRSAADGEPGPATGTLVEPADAPTVEVSHDGRWRLDGTITGATPDEPFWLVLGQSHNTGWSATIGGEELGEPTLVDGYANGWLVTPDAAELDVAMTFGPQRLVQVSLALSAVAAVGCVLLAWRRRTEAPFRRTPPPAPASVASWLRYRGTRPSVAVAVAVAMALAAGTALAAGIGVGLLVGAASAVALRWHRWRPLLALGAPVALGVAAAYVVIWQFRFDYIPGFEWPAEFARVHWLGLLAIALLVADQVVDRCWLGRGAPLPEERPIGQTGSSGGD
ncbi:alpha-(1-_3)-arabinofuranosyltransferase [soil metagenome]